jgi:hypothetical protein
VDRFPAEDFALALPKQAFSASAQVLKGKLLGLATITMNSKCGVHAGRTSSSAETTPPSISTCLGGRTVTSLLYFVNTNGPPRRRRIRGAGLVIKVHGYSIGDTTVVMPLHVRSVAPFSSLGSWT